MKKFANILDYSSYFKELVQYERNAEQQQHMKEIERYSPSKRERLGRAILGLKASYQGRGLGNTVLVKFGREEPFRNHEFSIGDLVIATGNKKPSGKEQTGSIVEISKRSITVAYISSAPNYLFRNKKSIRLDLFTNDVTFSRMIGALTKVKSHPRFKRILLGQPLPKLYDEEIKNIKEFYNPSLNSMQKRAVVDSINYNDIFFLHGPPGTGKTTTLVESIMQHSKQGRKILVCADSNIAVDNLVEKLLKFSNSVVRIGNTIKVTKDVIKHTLDYKLEEQQFFKDAQLLYNQVDEIKKKQQECVFPSRELKRGLSDSQIKRYARTRRTTRGIPIAIMKKMGAWLTHQHNISELLHKAKILEKLSIEEVLDDAQIICSTNVNAGSELLEEYMSMTKTKFDVCFVDEATQSVEPSTLIPALLAPKLILAGDHKQLPPTVLSEKAKGLKISLFERLVELYEYQHYVQLNIQYRMNEEIMKFSNKEFYNNTLVADKSVAHHRLNIEPKSSLSSLPVEIYSTSSSNSLEEKHPESTSYFNKKEGEIVGNFVESLLKANIPFEEIGVISPYDAQVQYIKKNIFLEDIEVKSIDGFQGREKDVIIVSFVRSNTKGNIGFLKDKRRLNVALTRARKKLILIGDTQTLKKDPLYKRMIESFSNSS